MEYRLDARPAPREETDSAARLVRIALAVYLSPVILIVLAIGASATLASKMMGLLRPTRQLAAEGPRDAATPMGLARKKQRVREMA
jgi:hypothetical protein